MGAPPALCDLHVAECRTEAGVLRTAGVDTKCNFTVALPQVANAHLAEMDAILTALHTVVALPPAEPVPHFLHSGRNIGGGPIGVPVVSHYTAQPLEVFIFVLDRNFQPILTVQIDCNSALVKPMMTFGKFCLYHKGKELFIGGHLQHRGVVIPESIVGALPQISVGLRHDFYRFLSYGDSLRLSGPEQLL